MRTYTLEVNRAGVVTLTVIIKQVTNGRDVSWWDADMFRNNPELWRRLRVLQQKGLLVDAMGCLVSKK